MNQIKVSIIIPIFNVHQYLRDCLNSVENQTMDDIEVILVNDGSTDGSELIAEEYLHENSNFKLINRSNGGLSAARNEGLQYARGEYVYFLDSDDFLKEDAIAKLYNRAKTDNLDELKFAAYTFEDGTSEYLWDRESSRGGYKYLGDYPDVMSGTDFFEKIIEFNDYYPSSCLMFTKLDVIKSNHLFFCEGIVHEDNIFNFILTNTCNRVGVLNEPLYYRRYRKDSIMTSNKWADKCRSFCVCAEEADRFIVSNNQVSKMIADWQMAFFLNWMIRYLELMSKEDQSSQEIKDYFLRVKPFAKKYNFRCVSLRLYYINPFIYSLFRDYIRNPLLKFLSFLSK